MNFTEVKSKHPTCVELYICGRWELGVWSFLFGQRRILVSKDALWNLTPNF